MPKPRIAQELHDLAIVSEKVHTMMIDIEQQAAKRIFRKGEDADVVIADLRQQAAQRLEATSQQLAVLPSFLQKDVTAITQRTPNGYYHHNAGEFNGAAS